jgi:hypothetical protein
VALPALPRVLADDLDGHVHSGGDAGEVAAGGVMNDADLKRWNGWRAKGAVADVRSQTHVMWTAAALMAGTIIWLAFELIRAAPPA